MLPGQHVVQGLIHWIDGSANLNCRIICLGKNHNLKCSQLPGVDILRSLFGVIFSISIWTVYAWKVKNQPEFKFALGATS